MAKRTGQFSADHYISPFNRGWYNTKHAHHQVNGETSLTQSLIILENETRKRS
ncbi:YpzG family protein [Aeribacillus pallidus]|jgi:hypothetical protein|uniref:YpzG family protein n=1 Tax=Aeribacillus pallidus TaxID=33936 RepID=UPI003D1EC32F